MSYKKINIDNLIYNVKYFQERLPYNSLFCAVVKSNYLYSVFAIMLFVSAVISVVAIILFKNRGKQMRLCNWAVFVILIYYIARYSCIISISNKFDYTFNVNVSDFFPLIALVLIVMARVAINKDDKLVKAADRIR